MKSNTIKALSAIGALALAAALPATSYAADNNGLIMDWNQAPHAPDQASTQPNGGGGTALSMDWNQAPHALTQASTQPNSAGSTGLGMDWNQAPHAPAQASTQPSTNADATATAASGDNGGHAMGR